jgi:alpha-tubulin suppressor-like RCC1 family protein
VGVSPGGGHACAIDTANLAWCWGTNGFGQLGSAPFSDQLSPKPVSGGFRFKAVHSGLVHTCALTAEGRAYCWGANVWGQLGNGNSTGASTVPVPVAAP